MIWVSRKNQRAFRADDVVGSPYCIRNYTVDPRLGGPDGLQSAREALARRGVGLILDFVPNHVAPDHPWTSTHPERLSALVRDGGSVVSVRRTQVFDARRLNVKYIGVLDQVANTEALMWLANLAREGVLIPRVAHRLPFEQAAVRGDVGVPVRGHANPLLVVDAATVAWALLLPFWQQVGSRSTVR